MAKGGSTGNRRSGGEAGRQGRTAAPGANLGSLNAEYQGVVRAIQDLDDSSPDYDARRSSLLARSEDLATQIRAARAAVTAARGDAPIPGPRSPSSRGVTVANARPVVTGPRPPGPGPNDNARRGPLPPGPGRPQGGEGYVPRQQREQTARQRLRQAIRNDPVMRSAERELRGRGLRMATDEESGYYARVSQFDNAIWVTDLE